MIHGMGPRLQSVTNLAGTQNIGQMLFNKAEDDADANLYAMVYIPAEEFESGVNADLFSHSDVNGILSSSSYWDKSDNETITQWILNQMGSTTSYIGTAVSHLSRSSGLDRGRLHRCHVQQFHK